MELHLPGGSSWFSTFVESRDAHQHSDADVLDDVSADDLAAALDALRRGDVEFVTLVDGEEFAQAAGDGEGPYQLEHHDGTGGDPTAVADAPYDLVVDVLGRYLAGDDSWRTSLGARSSSAPPVSPVTPEKRGLLGRLRGR
jgi:hypothetical protein